MAGKRKGKMDEAPKNKIITRVTDLKFRIIDQELKAIKKDGGTGKRLARKGAMEISVDRYEDDVQVGNSLKFRLGLISCWMDPATQLCLKAHVILNSNSAHQNSLIHLIQKEGEIPVSQSLSGLSSFTMVFEKNVAGPMIRYGCMPSVEIHASGTSSNDYRAYWVYDTKALAIKSIIDQLKLRKTIGGLNYVNFSKVPDDFLIGFGYEPIKDLLGRGVTMWKGDPSVVMEAGDSSSSRYEGYVERQNRNAESFLESLQNVIQGAA